MLVKVGSAALILKMFVGIQEWRFPTRTLLDMLPKGSYLLHVVKDYVEFSRVLDLLVCLLS